MSLYDITYDNRVPELLPPDKRYAVQVAWNQVLADPLQWLNDLWFHSYRDGSTVAAWNSASTYVKYDRVQYKNSIYESLINGNTDNPLITTSWFLVQANFIGIYERLFYNGNCLTLTWALNKWFRTSFRQPPNISDIYITTIAPATQNFFRSGNTEAFSSHSQNTTSSQFVFNMVVIGSNPNFTINIPVAVYNALDPLMINNTNIVRAFVDKYLQAGLTYTITTY